MYEVAFSGCPVHDNAGHGVHLEKFRPRLCHNKANSDSLLMAYYIVTLLASSPAPFLTDALKCHGPDVSLALPRHSAHPLCRLSLQAIASTLVMMDNGWASIKISLEQYLSETGAGSRTRGISELLWDEPHMYMGRSTLLYWIWVEFCDFLQYDIARET